MTRQAAERLAVAASGADSASAELPIGLWTASAIVVGTMIGAGIFMLPASLAPLGRNAPLGWLLSSVGALCIAFAMGLLSRLGSEGIQANIEQRLGPTVAFLVAWSFWVSNWVSQAAVALAGASALGFVLPSIAGPGAVMLVAIGAVALFTGVNGMGVRASGAVSMITVAVKLLPLAAVVLILAVRLHGQGPLAPLAQLPITIGNVATATALTFFALTGFENATTPVGKVRDPARVLPRAILGGTLFVSILYLLASTAIQYLLPVASVATSNAPFAQAISAEGGAAAAVAVAFALAIAAFGCLNALILGTGELGYAMALRQELPAVMARTSRGNVPVMAQIASSILSVMLIVANSDRATSGLFTFIILLSTSAILFVYLAGVIAGWQLVVTTAARVALTIALLFIAFAFYGSGVEADAWSLVLLAIGAGVRMLMKKFTATRATFAV